ncbi:MAG: PEP-CTERM sorting domain-containing protein [Proteobacteria bacterium]|nr:PEP-CTERM sorting domain-containing protein [Pseudomonadota bacterium]
MNLIPSSAIGASVLLMAGAASAQVTQVDLGGVVNTAYSIGGPVGLTAGNTGTALSSLTFDLRDPSTTSNVWVGYSTGDSITLHPDLYGVGSAYSLFNTLFGQAGLPTVSIEFKGSAGADQTFTLTGNTDIRDYNNWVWTNSINGTTTQEWWTNNLNPSPTDQSHRWDAQVYALAPAFATQTLTDIVITAGQVGGNYSQPMLAALDLQVAAVPEPASAALTLAGLLGLAAFATRRRSTDR